MPVTASKPTPKLPLDQAPPEGRLDVVAYKIAERLCNKLEERMGMTLWPSLKGHVESIVNEMIPPERIQLPGEVRVIIDILRKNGMNI
jgi:hypothetical protein